MSFVDLEPAALRMRALVVAIPDGRLDVPTPCTDYPLAALLDHVDRFTRGFTAAASKTENDAATESAAGDAGRLGAGWRAQIVEHLDALAPAWRNPAALEGTTRAGGVEMPGEIAVIVALEELVIHGWDVARATGQSYEAPDAELEVVEGFLAQFSGDGQEDLRGDAYAARADAPNSAPFLDRVIALSGRDPGWISRRE